MNTLFDVAVVGGGFAGAIAARDLCERGYSVALFEARDRVGGRAWTKKMVGRDDQVEMGGTWVSRSYMPAINREIERYGIETKTTRQPESSAFLTGGSIRAFPVPIDELGALDRLNVHILNGASRFQPNLPFGAQLCADLDISTDEFLAACDLPAATKDFINSLLSTWCGAHPKNVSMMHLLGWVSALGGTPYMALYESLVDKFANGSSNMVGTIIENTNARVMLSTPVQSIDATGDTVRITTAQGEAFFSKACVIAVPTNTLRDITLSPPLAASQQEAMDRGHACKPYKVHMIVKNVPEPVFALGAGSFQMLLSDYPLDNGDHLITAFGSQSICPIDLEDKDAVQAALREYFPEAKVVSVESHNWNDDPWSQGGWRMNPPGLAGDFSRLMLEPIDSKLFLAGTDVCESPLAGWIEGAVVSGYAAADKVTAFLKSKQSIKQSEI